MAQAEITATASPPRHGGAQARKGRRADAATRAAEAWAAGLMFGCAWTGRRYQVRQDRGGPAGSEPLGRRGREELIVGRLHRGDVDLAWEVYANWMHQGMGYYFYFLLFFLLLMPVTYLLTVVGLFLPYACAYDVGRPRGVRGRHLPDRRGLPQRVRRVKGPSVRPRRSPPSLPPLPCHAVRLLAIPHRR